MTGIDIVAAQIQIAAGASLEQLGLTQDHISTRGFAFQCRITTEDPSQNFAPDTGKIEVYRSAGGNGVRLVSFNPFSFPFAFQMMHFEAHQISGNLDIRTCGRESIEDNHCS